MFPERFFINRSFFLYFTAEQHGRFDWRIIERFRFKEFREQWWIKYNKKTLKANMNELFILCHIPKYFPFAPSSLIFVWIKYNKKTLKANMIELFILCHISKYFPFAPSSLIFVWIKYNKKTLKANMKELFILCHISKYLSS